MARPTKHAFRYRFVGRSTKLTPEVILKLEQVAMVRGTVAQSLYFANISSTTYFRWMQENPELKEHLNDLRQRRPLVANQNITKAIDNGDLALSKWEVEKSQSEEYGDVLTVKTDPTATHDEDKDAIDKLHETLRQNRLRRSRERAKAEGEIQ